MKERPRRLYREIDRATSKGTIDQEFITKRKDPPATSWGEDRQDLRVFKTI
jgi:hypothetical protein